MSSAMILMGGSSRSDGEGMISMELPGLQHGGGHHVDLSHQLQHHQQIMHHSLMDDSGKDGSMDSGNHGLNQEGPAPDMHVTLLEHEVHSWKRHKYGVTTHPSRSGIV
ncbi:hypothetical protein M8J75_008538 [Diaphorina citri]|nr:hypothetical protein M8J75_008538 [Diaphorina citri]